VRSSAGRANIWLAGIALAFAALAIAQSYAAKFSTAPDEQAHLVYVQSLALDGRIPRLPTTPHEPERYAPGQSVSHQGQHPPLYYAVAAAVYRAASVRDDERAYRVLRFLSIAIGLAALALQWRLACLVFQQAHLRLACLAILAFMPMFTYIMAVVNNDCLAVLFFIGALAAILRCISKPGDMWGPVKIGLWIAAAVATKESALALLPVAAAAILLARGGVRFRSRLLQAAVVVAVGLLPACAWWYRNWVLHGTPFVYAYVEPIFRSTSDALSKPGAAIFMLFITAGQGFAFFWGPWWELEKHIPLAAYVAGNGLVAVAAIVGVLLFFIDAAKRRPTVQVQVLPVALMLALVILVCIGIARYTLFVDFRALQGGRYLIVAWPALAVLITVGLSALMGRAAKIGLMVFGLLWLLWDAACILLVARG
jgi:4-amino-4-deoxy-L-arabinose transferase-like glycosyltransferase